MSSFIITPTQSNIFQCDMERLKMKLPRKPSNLSKPIQSPFGSEQHKVGIKEISRRRSEYGAASNGRSYKSENKMAEADVSKKDYQYDSVVYQAIVKELGSIRFRVDKVSSLYRQVDLSRHTICDVISNYKINYFKY